MSNAMNMFSSAIKLTLLCSVASAAASPLREDEYGPLNFRATFGNSPAPMTIDVNAAFISETMQKVALTRYPVDIDQPPFTEGVPSSNISAIRDYWMNEYDWSSVQKELNADFHHYTTTVGPLPSTYNYTRPIPLHFVHEKSPREDAIPLIFIHGWPGSFLEVQKLIEPLTNPPEDQQAFHVIAPSLIGFGFSPAATAPGMGLIETAAAYDELMHQLGYDQYVVQGGDFGAHTARYMGAMFPESVVSILSNLYGVFPNETDFARREAGETTEKENDYMDFIAQSKPLLDAFWGIESTLPLQIGMVLGDSPVGNVVWPYFGMVAVTPGYEWKLKDIITWGMMLFIQGPYASIRTYVEMRKERTLDAIFPYVPVPVGVLQYFGDAGYGAPRSWCERSGNITYIVEKPINVGGGHFPAHANPDDLVHEIRTFWGSAAGGWNARSY